MFGKDNNNRKNDRSSHSRDRTTVGVYVNEDDINIYDKDNNNHKDDRSFHSRDRTIFF